MWDGNINFGALDLLFYFVIGIATFAIAAPVGVLLIRRLNETWLDADWQVARRERQQDSIESIILAKSDSLVVHLCWGLLIEAAFAVAGAGFGAMVYLPGPLDGWFIFSMMLFGAGGSILGLFVNLAMLLACWPKLESAFLHSPYQRK